MSYEIWPSSPNPLSPAAIIPPLTNLRAALQEIHEQSASIPLVDAGRRAVVAYSCALDIKQARIALDQMEALDALDRKKTELDVHSIRHHLLMSAINYYVRATAIAARSGNPKERGSTDVRKGWSSTLRDDHQSIVELRHEMLVHVKFDRAFDEHVWHQAHLLAVAKEKQWQPMFASTRTSLHPATVERLRRLTAAAEPLMLSKAKEYATHVAKILGEMVKTMDVGEILLRHRIDPIEFFGSVEEAAAQMRPTTTGQSSVRVISPQPSQP